MFHLYIILYVGSGECCSFYGCWLWGTELEFPWQSWDVFGRLHDHPCLEVSFAGWIMLCLFIVQLTEEK